MDNKDRIAFGLIAGLIITVGTSTALVLSGAEVPNEYRMGIVAYTVFVSFVATAVFGRDK
jgi:hypothetical protein